MSGPPAPLSPSHDPEAARGGAVPGGARAAPRGHVAGEGAYLRSAHAPPRRGGPSALHQPSHPRDEPVPPPARPQPGDWRPWGEEAFEDARRTGRPVFLSVGYSTCHWCHVMEGESFEDEEIARVLNEHYVPIKVDREERPDVDAALHDGGADPDRRRRLADERLAHAGAGAVLRRDVLPAARRRPRRARGFLSILVEIADVWAKDAQRVKAATASLVDGGPRGARARTARRPRGMPGAEVLEAAFHGFRRRVRRRARRPPRRAQVPLEPAGPAPPAPPPPRGDAEALRMATRDAREDGRGRPPRSGRRRLPPLLDRRELARPALREDALRQRAARGRLRRGVAGDRPARLRARRARRRSTTSAAR